MGEKTQRLPRHEIRTDLQEPRQRFREAARRNLDVFLSAPRGLEIEAHPAPRVSIVIAAFNSAELTFACLTCIAEHANLPVEVIVVDNGSSDDTASLLACVPGLQILRNGENLGFLAAANQGAAAARADHVLFLNNDAYVRHGTIAAALETIESDPSIGAVGGPQLDLDGLVNEAGKVIWNDGYTPGYCRGSLLDAPEVQFRRSVGMVSGAFILVRRKLFGELGGFDPIFAPGYYEETDLCLRLWERGLKVVYDPGAIIDHFRYGSAVDYETVYAQLARNRDLLVEKHRAALARQFPFDAANWVWARHHLQPRGRVLICDMEAAALFGDPENSDTEAGFRQLKAHDWFATLIGNDPGQPRPAHLAEVEIFAADAALPTRLLGERAGYYDLIAATDPATIGLLREWTGPLPQIVVDRAGAARALMR